MPFSTLHNKNYSKGVFWVMLSLFIALIISIICQSRAFSIGYIAAISVLIFQQHISFIKVRARKSILFFSISFLIVVAVFIKWDSSLGRLLIYKINVNILKDHFFQGVGLNKYGVFYTKYQAQYFSLGNFTQKELLLADNVRFAFNDYLQFIVETGVAGAILVVLFLLFIVKLSNSSIRCKPERLHYIALFFTGQLISFCIAALFRPVFYKIHFLSLFLVSLVFVLSFTFFRRRKIIGAVAINVLVIGSVLCYYYQDYIKYPQCYKRFNDAREIYYAGYVKEGRCVFDSLYYNLKRDYTFLDVYSAMLMAEGSYSNAIPVLRDAMKISGNASLFTRMAHCYYKMGNFKNAEIYYLTATWIIPNRFIAKYDLYEFYNKTNQHEKASEIGKIILELPVKVPSLQIERIKSTVQQQIGISSSLNIENK